MSRALIENLTNNELLTMCENNGYAVNTDMVKVLCERLESSHGEMLMFKTLNQKMTDVNARLQVELGMYLDEVKAITEG